MAFNAGKWAGLLGEGSAPALQAPAAAASLAGTRPMGFLGTGSYDDFQKLFQTVPEKDREAFMNFATINALMGPTMKQLDPEWQKEQLKLAEEAQTKKGWKSLMFNTLGSGLDNLTKGIAMSMNPYGTPEAARYAADMIAGSGDRLAAAYAAARTPLAIPAVQGGQAPTYF
jgi:hypothetical protein